MFFIHFNSPSISFVLRFDKFSWLKHKEGFRIDDFQKKKQKEPWERNRIDMKQESFMFKGKEHLKNIILCLKKFPGRLFVNFLRGKRGGGCSTDL